MIKIILNFFLCMLFITIESGKAINTTAEHPCYVRNQESLDNCSDICFVEIAMPMSNNKDSYVHSGMFFAKQRATKSSSFSCLPSNCFALGINDLYSSNGTILILLNNNSTVFSNSASYNPDFDKISSLFLKNSSFNFCGAYNLSLSLKNRSIISPPEIKVLNNMFESTPASIYISPLFFKSLCIDNLTLSDNSSASFSVNLLLATSDLNKAFCNSPDSDSCFSKTLKIKNSLINTFRSKPNSSASFFNSSGIDMHISSMLNIKDKDYINFSKIINNQQLTNAQWIEVRHLKVGDEIAVPDYSTGAIRWEKIISIKEQGEEHVYDLAIEDTRNFIANDIVAHNTYIGNLVLSSDSISTNNITSKSRNISFYNDTGSEIMKIDGGNARVGIGTAAPGEKLEINGNLKMFGNIIFDSQAATRKLTSVNGAFNLETPADEHIYFDAGGNFLFRDQDASDATRVVIESGSGNVGIGTTSPTYKLDVSNSTQGLSLHPTGGVSNGPILNTTGSVATNVTITSSAGSVIIKLG